MPSSVASTSASALLAQAPPHPDNVALPAAYIPHLCKLCRTWSNTISPVPPEAFPAFAPLIPWYKGTKERPTGHTCKICQIVYELGSWSEEAELKDMDAMLQRDVTRQHGWLVKTLASFNPVCLLIISN